METSGNTHGFVISIQLEIVEISPKRQHIPEALALINTFNLFWMSKKQLWINVDEKDEEPKQQGSATSELRPFIISLFICNI